MSCGPLPVSLYPKGKKKENLIIKTTINGVWYEERIYPRLTNPRRYLNVHNRTLYRHTTLTAVNWLFNTQLKFTRKKTHVRHLNSLTSSKNVHGFW